MRTALVLQQIPSGVATPEMLYDLYRRHRLVPDSMVMALAGFRTMAEDGNVYEVRADDAVVATVIVSGVIPGERADVDIVPVSKFFRGGYETALREAMDPIWERYFDVEGCRRLTSSVPASRRRTVKALKALGFRVEGVVRDGVMIANKDPEDLIIMGLLPRDLED
jgi:RimJ/RimL family protein N-acetyltransferase